MVRHAPQAVSGNVIGPVVTDRSRMRRRFERPGELG
jgi:hypothetical protein